MEDIPKETEIQRTSQHELLINNNDANQLQPNAFQNSKAEDNVDEYYESLKNSKFKQQAVAAWRPKPTIYSTTATFVAFGVVFIFIGIFVISFSKQVVERSIEYSSQCESLNTTCTIQFELKESISKAPIMVFYQLDNFHQNHRKYVSSRNDAQLSGQLLGVSDLSECEPLITNAQMNKTRSVNDTLLDPEAPAIPCGLFAHTYFNDRFSLSFKLPNGTDVPVAIDENGIAWSSDVKTKYKNSGDGWESRQWLNMTDEHFLVWMRPSAFPSFRKLWGKINTTLEKGNYTLSVENNYDVKMFEGKKSLVISTINVFGGKNDFLGISYLVVGSACVVVAVVWVLAYRFYQEKNNKEEHNTDANHI